MNKPRLFSALLFILFLAGFSIYLANPYGASLFGKNFTYRLGLDLQGGTHLVYQGDLSGIDPAVKGDAMNAVRDVIERRVNAFGVSEAVVQVSGEDRLIVELPGVFDIDAAIDLIGQTPFLEFREENPDFVLPEDPEAAANADPKDIFKPTELTGAHLVRAEVTFSSQTSGISTPQVALYFDSEGKKMFADITERNLGKRVAIFLDGNLISAPIVQNKITEGQAVITGNFTIEEAKELATRLNSGALPVPIKLLSQQNIGPSLGQVSIDQSAIAGVIGLLSVALFMIVYYRFPGLLSAIALFFYTVIALSIFKLFGITLTLASIAGFILSIGIAIDANILIFERTKEELRRGKNLTQAIEEGFKRAWPSIRDSNLSSLITAAVLVTGTSFIRGFAITLGIGILVSMFSAIIITRTFLRLATLHKNFNTPRLFGVKPQESQ